MLYLLIIIITHIIALFVVIRRKRIYRFDIDMEKVFTIVSEYMLTKSILRSRLFAGLPIDRESLFSDRPVLITEGIKVSSIPIDSLERKHLEERFNNVMLEIDEHLNKLDMYGVLLTGSIVFPILLSMLAIIYIGPLILSLTPLIQLILLWVVSRWIRR